MAPRNTKPLFLLIVLTSFNHCCHAGVGGDGDGRYAGIFLAGSGALFVVSVLVGTDYNVYYIAQKQLLGQFGAGLQMPPGNECPMRPALG